MIEAEKADPDNTKTINEARRGAYTWIDGWYNARRRHSALGYISPPEYERRQLTLAA